MTDADELAKKLAKRGSVISLMIALVMLLFASLVLFFIGPKLQARNEEFDSPPEGVIAVILSIPPQAYAAAAFVVAVLLVAKEIIFKAGAFTSLINFFGMLFAVAVALAYVVASYGALVQTVT